MLLACFLLVAIAAANSPTDELQQPVASPSASPVSRIARKERYLLYDVIFHEQVNKQRRALMFYLDLAMRLKRTLVLPRTRLLRRKPGRGIQFEPVAQYVPWGELFNVSALATLHPIMDLEQYLDLHGGVAMHVKISHRGCEPTSTPSQVPFNGLENGLDAEQSICHHTLQYSVSQLLGRVHNAHAAIAFSESVDQLQPAQVLPLRPYVRFEQSVYDRAAAFVEKSFGGKPFVSVHWRRTDFLAVRASQPGVLQSAHALTRHVRGLMRRFGIEHVYLATDCDDPRELEAVRSALQPVRYTMPAAAAASKDQLLRAKVDMANVEIAICAMGARFLGTKTSSFTLVILEERSAIFGHGVDTAAEMDVSLPPEGKDEL